MTGASGLLGRELKVALAKGNEVLGLSHMRKSENLVQIDLRDADLFTSKLREFVPDLVVHCAAYRDPDFCAENTEEALRLNVETTNTICRAVPNSTRIVLISSDYVFDGKNPPYDEMSARSPINFYGETKMMSEDIIAERGNGLALRVPVLIGRDDSFEQSGFIYNMVKAVRSKTEVKINDINIRYPTWTRDFGRAIRFAIDSELEGVLHFSGREGGTQYYFALRTAKMLGESHSHIRPLRDQDSRKAPRPLNSQLSCGLINSLGFEHVTSYDEVLYRALIE